MVSQPSSKFTALRATHSIITVRTAVVNRIICSTTRSTSGCYSVAPLASTPRLLPLLRAQHSRCRAISELPPRPTADRPSCARVNIQWACPTSLLLIARSSARLTSSCA
eukprot:687907-Pleurochrysis_carterae.AAC.1